jgi:hypothetical protein
MTGLGGAGGAVAAAAARGIGKRRLRHRNRHQYQRQQLLSGPEFIANISPMKRILCLCPVLSSPDKADATLVKEGYQHYRVGMAVSDPYLAYATPIEVHEEQSHGLYVYKGIGSINKAAHPTYWKGMVPTKQDFLKQIGYPDIGGVAFARPLRMQQTRITQLDEEKLDDARRCLQCVLNNFTDGIKPSTTDGVTEVCDIDVASTRVRPSEFNLQTFIDRSPSYEKALEMAQCEPEMWEAIDLEAMGEGCDNVPKVTPSIQAASVLNSFLPGWSNTFA